VRNDRTRQSGLVDDITSSRTPGLLPELLGLR
jgi:hypothetical protein